MGKAKPILIDDMSQCMICGRPYPQWHHVFSGTANRKISDKLGYIVPLCIEHHTGSNGVHNNRQLELQIKALAQKHYEENLGSRECFIKIFGKSYL